MLVDKQHVETGAARFTVYCALSFDDLTASCVHPQVDGMRVNPSFQSFAHSIQDGKLKQAHFVSSHACQNRILRQIPSNTFSIDPDFQQRKSLAPRHSKSHKPTEHLVWAASTTSGHLGCTWQVRWDAPVLNPEGYLSMKGVTLCVQVCI